MIRQFLFARSVREEQTGESCRRGFRGSVAFFPAKAILSPSCYVKQIQYRRSESLDLDKNPFPQSENPLLSLLAQENAPA